MTATPHLLAAGVRIALRRLRDVPSDLEAADNPAFTAEQINFLEKRLYEVRALLEAIQPSNGCTDIDHHVHQLLARHRQIAVIWSIEDVKGVRPHLTDDQAWQVLEQIGDKHDAETGISWMTLEDIADDMFPNVSE